MAGNKKGPSGEPRRPLHEECPRIPLARSRRVTTRGLRNLRTSFVRLLDSNKAQSKLSKGTSVYVEIFLSTLDSFNQEQSLAGDPVDQFGSQLRLSKDVLKLRAQSEGESRLVTHTEHSR